MTATPDPPAWRSALGDGATRWFPLVASIAAWAVHIVALASLVQSTCNTSGREWVLHAITAACVAVAVVALLLAVRLARRVDSRDGLAFFGRVSVVVAGINIALIVLEEVYVVAFHGHSCG